MRVREIGIPSILFVLLAVGTAQLACSRSMPRAPEAFPDTDLIFQTGTLWDEGGHEGLGFVNADGSGLSHLKVSIPNEWGTDTPPVLPVVTNDGSMVVFRLEGNPYMPGGLVTWQVGEPARSCSVDWGSYRPSLTVGDTQAVIDLTGPGGRLMILDLADCQGTASQVSGKVMTLAPPDTHIHGTLSPDGRRLIHARWTSELKSGLLVVHTLSSGDEVPLTQGIGPAWSPNGQWIAFTWVDGIYRTDPQGSDIRRIVDYTSPDSGGRPPFNDWWPPLPSWSPDGQWLVYHKCILPAGPKVHCGSSINDYAIFKVNVETGEEIKILDGGLNPYWRWKPAQP